MNAVVGLCHFCETHGPRVVLSTEAGSEGSVTEEGGAGEGRSCSACSPASPALITARYSSGRQPGCEPARRLLSHACVRSLSCEVSSGKENNLVFFGDSTRGHVLSYAFQIQDTQARGLKRWFSFIVLMRDKIFLLNVTPFLAKQMEDIAKELQSLASAIFAKDQAICSQRVLRLKNYKTGDDPPRSLIELTGKKNIFAYLHLKFSFMLNSCSRLFTEKVCDGLLPAELANNKLALFTESKLSLYSMKEYFGRDIFLNIVYCILTGIQIIIRGDSDMCNNIVSTLLIFLPKIPKYVEYSDYVPPGESRIFSCKSDVAVPKSCAGILRIDIVDGKPLIHWHGILPKKWPVLMTNIIKAFDNELKEDTLIHHLTAMKEEWLNNAMVLQSLQKASSTEENILCIKKTMSIKLEDEEVLQYWIANFC